MLYCFSNIFTIETSMVAMVMDYFSIAYEFYFSAKVMARTFENMYC